MRKTKRSMRDTRTCRCCAAIIHRGDRYGSTSICIGSQSCYALAGPIPDHSWTPYRVTVSLCEACCGIEAGELRSRLDRETAS